MQQASSGFLTSLVLAIYAKRTFLDHQILRGLRLRTAGGVMREVWVLHVYPTWLYFHDPKLFCQFRMYIYLYIYKLRDRFDLAVRGDVIEQVSNIVSQSRAKSLLTRDTDKSRPTINPAHSRVQISMRGPFYTANKKRKLEAPIDVKMTNGIWR